MPNIIEQQDLLKGLPDTRLAQLLQNPMGDIPPFLVAAEAQRRQAIRQQFAGSANQESVVDSLTKQLAKVPQNIQAPAQTPPNIPPTPQMAGVAALQQQQMMAQPEQQMMRAGGPVRRFQFGGFVPGAPAAGSAMNNRVKEIADQFGVTVEDAANMIKNNPSLVGGVGEADLGKPFEILETNQEPNATPSALNLPGITTSLEELAKIQRERFRDAKYNEMDEYGGYGGTVPIPGQRNKLEFSEREARRFPDSGVNAPAGGVPPPEEGETPDEYRARIEALFAVEEPTGMDKAQAWFAMAEQFLDPSKTTAESLAGAGRAFTENRSAMNAEQRRMKLERDKALLEYDMAERNRIRAAEAERANREFETQQKIAERRTPTASNVLESYKVMIDNITDEINETFDTARKNQLIAEKNALVAALSKIISDAGLGPGNVVTEEQLKAIAGAQ